MYINWKPVLVELIDQKLPIDVISRKTGLSRDIIRALNPDYKGNIGGSTNQRLLTRYGAIKQHEVECHVCGVKFNVKEHEKSFPKKSAYYCSMKCSKARTLTASGTAEKKRKNSVITQKSWNNGTRTNSNNLLFSSKGERELLELLRQLQPENEWATGGLRYKGIQRDIFSKKLKVSVEYDGIWHFRNIKNQLQKKLRKDMFYELWCKKNGWLLIRIDEDTFQTDKLQALNKITELINNKTTGCVKFWVKKNINDLKQNTKTEIYNFLIANVR